MATQRLRPEGHKFKTSLGNLGKPCFKVKIKIKGVKTRHGGSYP